MKAFVLREEKGIKFAVAPQFEKTGLVQHGFSCRVGGISEEPYKSLNLGLHVGDKTEAVVENRRRFLDVFGLELKDMVAAEQVHGTAIKRVEFLERGRGAQDYSTAFQAIDALITKEKGVVLTTYYADCVPIFLLDPRTPAIALIHAGWKGTVGGIVAKTISEMVNQFGSPVEEIIAAIGPSIGPCCYEVDSKVAEPVESFFGASSNKLLKSTRPNHWLLDLWEANRLQLLDNGVLADNITLPGFCTFCEESFFSYRRESGITGRMAAILSLG